MLYAFVYRGWSPIHVSFTNRMRTPTPLGYSSPMRTSIVTAQDRARQRFDRLAAQVVRHARLGERDRIDRVIAAVDVGAITVPDAHAALASLRAQQQATSLGELTDTADVASIHDWGHAGT